MKVIKYGVCAIAAVLMGLFVWQVNQPDQATQDYIERMEQVGL